MKNILLACSAGMSTSLLVTKMEEAAKSRGIDVTIWQSHRTRHLKTWKRRMSC